jgi:type I restriction enzyme S subunit
MGNILDGRLTFEKLKYLPADHPEFPDLLLEPGDILFNRTNSAELVGKSAVFQGPPEACSFASYLIRVRVNEQVLPEYLCAYINSSFGRAWIASVVSQQVGQANVNGSKLRSLTVPLPPLSEQKRRVSELDRCLSLEESSRASIASLMARAESLRRAILRRAFKGRLVDQDPTDEPADQLLARIRAERSQASARPQRRAATRR